MKTKLLFDDLRNVLRFIRDEELQDAEKLLSDIIVDVSFLTDEDVAAQDLARITAQLDAAISDLQDAVDYVYNVYGESNETLAAITTAHWRAVIADVKKNSV